MLDDGKMFACARDPFPGVGTEARWIDRRGGPHASIRACAPREAH